MGSLTRNKGRIYLNYREIPSWWWKKVANVSVGLWKGVQSNLEERRNWTEKILSQKNMNAYLGCVYFCQNSMNGHWILLMRAQPSDGAKVRRSSSCWLTDKEKNIGVELTRNMVVYLWMLY